MVFLKKSVLSIFLATIWISASEFIRNEIFLKTHWTSHYEEMGLVFPSEPVNGALWVRWSCCVACASFVLALKFSLLQTALLSWFFAFVLKWLVAGNMQVLPLGILPYAIPLGLLDAF